MASQYFSLLRKIITCQQFYFANSGQHGCLSYQYTILSYVALQMALEKYLSIQYVDSSVKTQDNNQQLSSRLDFVCSNKQKYLGPNGNTAHRPGHSYNSSSFINIGQ